MDGVKVGNQTKTSRADIEQSGLPKRDADGVLRFADGKAAMSAAFVEVVEENAQDVQTPQLYGPGPDGVPDRRVYPAKGLNYRQSEPKGNQVRPEDSE